MKVLVAIDDSEYSKHVIQAVCRRHWAQDTEFRILSVVEPIDADELEDLECRAMVADLQKKRTEHSVAMCDAARHQIESRVPDCHVHYTVVSGSPKVEILRSAIQWDADRILVGAHGHSVCPHNMGGSVSRAVASKAHCTVEIIRPIQTVHAERQAV